MALNIAINGVCTGTPQNHFSLHSHQPLHPKTTSFSSFSRKPSHITNAKKATSRTGRFDSRNKKGGSGGGGGGLSTTIKEEEEEVVEEDLDVVDDIDDGYFLPELPGDKPDPFEGEKWDGLGFFVQYLWAFGIVFALIACGIAVATYNEGATDFKKTPVYKESIQSRELLEEPDASNSDIFEANPTEEAPSLE